MPQFANIIPSPGGDGILYASQTVMGATEVDLCNQTPGIEDPVPIRYGEAVLAVVQFTAGSGAAAPTYVVLQTDLGDGVWIDIASCQWSGVSGSATFVLAAGVGGSNSFQQTRQAGTAPGNTSQQCALGGRFRFVGKTAPASSAGPGSSSVGPAMQVTIRYRILGLR